MSAQHIAVHISDLHLGVRDTPDVDVSISNIVSLLNREISGGDTVRLTINGDLIAAPGQRHHLADWEAAAIKKLKPLARFLERSAMETVYLPGNCEKSADMHEDVIRRRFSGAKINFVSAHISAPRHRAHAKAFSPIE